MKNQDKELKKLIDKAIKEDKCFTKSRLKGEFRLKPKPDTEPVYTYKDYYRNEIGMYSIKDCIPLKKYTKKPQTEAQKKATKKLALIAKTRSNLYQTSKEVDHILTKDCVFLDTETTGLGDKDQIISIAICNKNGETLINEVVKPTVKINEKASEVHGFYEKDLINKPLWSEIEEKIKSTLKGKIVIIFNEEFDYQMLVNNNNAFNLSIKWINLLNTVCAMDIAAKAYGATNRYGSISLADATDRAGIEFQGEAHTALGDTLTTLKLLNKIAKYHKEIDEEIKNLK